MHPLGARYHPPAGHGSTTNRGPASHTRKGEAVYSRGGACPRPEPLPPTLNPCPPCPCSPLPPTLKSCPRQVLHPSKTGNSQTLPPFFFICFQNRNMI